jgi:hypothetical protein
MFQNWVLEKIQTHIVCSINFPLKIVKFFLDNVEICGTARQGTDDNIIRSMRIKYGITKATKTHWVYVIVIAFFDSNNGCTNASEYYLLRKWPVLCLLCTVQVVVSATSWALYQKILTGCLRVCDPETLTTKRPRLNLGCYATKKKFKWLYPFKCKGLHEYNYTLEVYIANLYPSFISFY